MDINARLETRVSKAGREYKCIVIKLSPTSEKLVFLQPAELELLALYNRAKNVEK